MVELDKPYFTSDKKDTVVTFKYDEFAESPREYSETTFVTWIRNRCSPDKGEFDNPNDLFDEITNGDYYWSKVYATIHSGISYYRPGTHIMDSWDSGFAGFIYIKKERAHECYNLKSPSDIYEIFDMELDEYTQYSNGECYCCDIEYLDESCDCCSGYYDLAACVESTGEFLGFSEKDLIEATVKKVYV